MRLSSLALVMAGAALLAGAVYVAVDGAHAFRADA
jgi:hypothetical protein